ncbi:hypothetical protein [Mycoplasmopsis iners]|uniref:hypothetical protein n=1 Tax=Mycoplasmopsis iners TaxID=76630 RepID=UPI0004951F3B|nr:hypothetical protein [Mycoplasmopsis iners]
MKNQFVIDSCNELKNLLESNNINFCLSPQSYFDLQKAKSINFHNIRITLYWKDYINIKAKFPEQFKDNESADHFSLSPFFIAKNGIIPIDLIIETNEIKFHELYSKKHRKHLVYSYLNHKPFFKLFNLIGAKRIKQTDFINLVFEQRYNGYLITNNSFEGFFFFKNLNYINLSAFEKDGVHFKFFSEYLNQKDYKIIKKGQSRLRGED